MRRFKAICWSLGIIVAGIATFAMAGGPKGVIL